MVAAVGRSFLARLPAVRSLLGFADRTLRMLITELHCRPPRKYFKVREEGKQKGHMPSRVLKEVQDGVKAAPE